MNFIKSCLFPTIGDYNTSTIRQTVHAWSGVVPWDNHGRSAQLWPLSVVTSIPQLSPLPSCLPSTVEYISFFKVPSTIHNKISYNAKKRNTSKQKVFNKLLQN